MSTAVKARKQFILEQQKINQVKKIVQAKTDTEAITRALDIIIENSKIDAALQAVKGKGRIKDIYGRTAA
ncbi:MAG TPA: hypothetical protein VI956_05090 [Nitrospirota bacterium]|nr:hypothetical protein [Nitrospirota bacterium]